LLKPIGVICAIGTIPIDFIMNVKVDISMGIVAMGFTLRKIR